MDNELKAIQWFLISGVNIGWGHLSSNNVSSFQFGAGILFFGVGIVYCAKIAGGRN